MNKSKGDKTGEYLFGFLAVANFIGVTWTVIEYQPNIILALILYIGAPGFLGMAYMSERNDRIKQEKEIAESE